MYVASRVGAPAPLGAGPGSRGRRYSTVGRRPSRIGNFLPSEPPSPLASSQSNPNRPSAQNFKRGHATRIPENNQPAGYYENCRCFDSYYDRLYDILPFKQISAKSWIKVLSFFLLCAKYSNTKILFSNLIFEFLLLNRFCIAFVSNRT